MAASQDCSAYYQMYAGTSQAGMVQLAGIWAMQTSEAMRYSTNGGHDEQLVQAACASWSSTSYDCPIQELDD